MNQYIRIGSELLPYPKVEMFAAENIFSDDLKAYNEWKSKAITIPEEYLGAWEEGQVVEESEFEVLYQIAKIGSNDYKTVHHREYKNHFITNKREVAIPITKEPAQQEQRPIEELFREAMQKEAKERWPDWVYSDKRRLFLDGANAAFSFLRNNK